MDEQQKGSPNSLVGILIAFLCVAMVVAALIAYDNQLQDAYEKQCQTASAVATCTPAP